MSYQITAGRRERAKVAALVGVYLAAIVTANIITARYGPTASVYNAFALIGLDLITRDRLADFWGTSRWRKMTLLIAAGSVISFLVAQNVQAIAEASAISFACAETGEGVLYHALRRREWVQRANGSVARCRDRQLRLSDARLRRCAVVDHGWTVHSQDGRRALVVGVRRTSPAAPPGGQGVIHYHGTPITPRPKLLELAGRCFCVSFAAPHDIAACHEIGQAAMLDNGAFTFWRTGRCVSWDAYYEWCERWLEYRTTWAVIPDVIAGSAGENDRLLDQWPFGIRGAPVWHMHEPIRRLLQLADCWPRICVGSSQAYRSVASRAWHERMTAAMNALCGDGPVPVWLHMLRGLRLAGSSYPFASADSTNVARNHAGTPTRGIARRSPGAMAAQIDRRQCPGRWHKTSPRLARRAAR